MRNRQGRGRSGLLCLHAGRSDGRTLFITAAEWRGFENMVGDARTGQLLGVAAPAPGAGWPSYTSGTR
ncbi:hypothetical protein [Mesorhizobium sp.]|uniref:hypothetical protein n=1 Tax=Mesorhizobium sp. TaxID=1871066 RepID=UPI0025B7D1D5|nr:hypothetical protein [Mesorhizobium sp.]